MTNKILHTFDIVKEAAKMGYGAFLDIGYEGAIEDSLVIHIAEDFIVVRLEKWTKTMELSEVSESTVKGFLYVGNLFGKPFIKEKQKFRVKMTGEILENTRGIPQGIEEAGYLIELGNEQRNFYPDEIEPVFE